jgi:hypothetical protein
MLILHSHLSPGLQSARFTAGVLTKILHTFFIYPMRNTRFVLFILLIREILFREVY